MPQNREKRVSESKTPISHHPNKGCSPKKDAPSQKSPFSCSALCRQRDFLTQSALFWGGGKWGFLTPKPSFPDFGDFGRRIPKVREEESVHDHHRKQIIWTTFLASKKTIQASGGYKSPVKTRQSNIHHRNLSSVGPHSFLQRKVPHWSRVVYGFFSQQVVFFAGWCANCRNLRKIGCTPKGAYGNTAF